ncbi:MAG: RcpC/CpaB family pilus assembly protein [Acutalibacter sp.]
MKLNNRFIFGILSLVLAAVIAFVALPTIARQTNGKTEIVRITQPVLKGETITSDNAEVVEVGGYNLPSNVAHSMEDVEGLYVTADLAAGDYILTSKVSTVPVSSDVALNDIPSGKVAISLTVKTLASGLSDKLQPGDIIRIYHFLETAEEVPELRFVKVLSVTDSDGINVDNTKEPTEDEEPQQSATITVLASPEQARIITEMENDGVAHVALISRNNDQLAEELLAEQDKTLQEIYFPETLVEENAESQDGGEAAEGAADGESTGEAGSDGAEGGTETTPADSIPEDGE